MHRRGVARRTDRPEIVHDGGGGGGRPRVRSQKLKSACFLVQHRFFSIPRTSRKIELYVDSNFIIARVQESSLQSSASEFKADAGITPVSSLHRLFDAVETL